MNRRRRSTANSGRLLPQYSIRRFMLNKQKLTSFQTTIAWAYTYIHTYTHNSLWGSAGACLHEYRIDRWICTHVGKLLVGTHTNEESSYSFHRHTDGGRLSRSRHCRKGAQPVPKAVLSQWLSW